MENNKETKSGETTSNIKLISFSVVITGRFNDPSIINQDFLKHENVIDADLEIKEPPLVTPVFSQVAFTNGLAIRAEPDRVIFEQQAPKLTKNDIVCVETSKRFINNVGIVSYNSVGINPKGIRNIPPDAQEKVVNTLVERGKWASFKDVTPEVHLKTVYRYENRMITLDIGEVTSKINDNIEPPCMMFQANIHRPLAQITPPERVNLLISILDSWEDDLEDFRNIVKKYDSKRFRK